MKILGLKRDEVKQKLIKGEITIAVYGLGKIGLPLAVVFAEHGAKVIGVDVNDKLIDFLSKGETPTNEEPGLSELLKRSVKSEKLKITKDGISASKEADVMIILVPTFADKKSLYLDPIYDVAKKISKGLKKGDVVITESTMPPGTTESLIPIFEDSGLRLGEFGLAHAPERVAVGTAIRDITSQYPKIVGASDEKTLEAVIGLYETINKKGVIPMSSIKAAEAVKVFEGVYRDVNIALANELATWCEDHGLNVMEIINAANTQPYCNLHIPGAGVGGHCIPVYPWFLIHLAKKNYPQLIRLARKINESMPKHVMELLMRGLNEVGLPLKGCKVLVLGLTFRGGVKEFANSPSLEIIKELKDWGVKVYVYDPICNKDDAEKFGVEWKDDFKDIDAVIIATDHKEFKKLDLKRMKVEMRHNVIIDGRHVLEKSVRNLGFIYLAVGNV
ncbi:MAG: nucleotide sugar dehydrogenase [Archaeoglobaceae archaeon]|nr:nucleotide sugar dehydrogenase [Archaeoglobaceae archaeon]